jgi:hypothetical protein
MSRIGLLVRSLPAMQRALYYKRCSFIRWVSPSRSELSWSYDRRSSKFEVTLFLTVSQSVCLGIEYPCGTCDQVILPVGMLLSEICGLLSQGVEVEITLLLTTSQPVCLGIEYPCGTCDQIFQVQVTLRPTVSRPACLGVRHLFRTRDQFFLSWITFRQLLI